MNSQAGIVTENFNINECELGINQYEYDFEKKYEDDLKVLFTDFEGNLHDKTIRKIFFDSIKQATGFMSDFDVLFDLFLTFQTEISQNNNNNAKNAGYEIFKLLNKIHHPIRIVKGHHHSSLEQKYCNFITQRVCDKNLLNKLKYLYYPNDNETAESEDQYELFANDYIFASEEIIFASDITKLKEYIDMIYKNSLKVLSVFYSNSINNDILFQFSLTDFHKKSLFDFYDMEKPILKKVDDNNEKINEEKKEDRVDNEINDQEIPNTKLSPVKLVKGAVILPLDKEKGNTKSSFGA